MKQVNYSTLQRLSFIIAWLHFFAGVPFQHGSHGGVPERRARLAGLFFAGPSSSADDDEGSWWSFTVFHFSSLAARKEQSLRVPTPRKIKKQSLIKFAKFCFAADPVCKKPCRFRFFASWCTVHAFFFLDKSVSMHFLFKNIDANKPPEHSNHPLSMSSRLSNVIDWQTLTHFSLRWGFQGHRIPLGRLENFAQPGTMSRVAMSLCLSILFSKAVDRETSIIWRWDLSKLQNRTIRQGDHWPTDRWSLDHQSCLHIFSCFLRFAHFCTVCTLYTLYTSSTSWSRAWIRRIYVDPTVPLRWRSWVKQGVEASQSERWKIERLFGNVS